jgi:predicted metal-dependent HD superfamily phosphohydrolase
VAVLIDPPRWPAHGTRFSHLVSDTSLAELLEFADANGVPVRAFDHDHYDVAERRHADLVAAGALPVAASELLRRLLASGLRVRTPERTPKRAQVLPSLTAAWDGLLPTASGLRDELLRRWQEPHRHYHDVRHLAQVLTALDLLADGSVSRPVALAAWFHDAVYDGEPGADEERSAELAAADLAGTGLPAAEVAEVVRLVRLTARHEPEPGDAAGVQLVDADLSILGQSAGRYHVYSRDVRLEYSRFSDEIFAAGRIRVLEGLSSFDPLYRSPTGRRRWEAQAAHNLAEERRRWLRFVPSTG